MPLLRPGEVIILDKERYLVTSYAGDGYFAVLESEPDGEPVFFPEDMV